MDFTKFIFLYQFRTPADLCYTKSEPNIEPL